MCVDGHRHRVGCLDAPLEDDCLGEVEERAWSSPIFVDFEGDQPGSRGS